MWVGGTAEQSSETDASYIATTATITFSWRSLPQRSPVAGPLCGCDVRHVQRDGRTHSKRKGTESQLQRARAEVQGGRVPGIPPAVFESSLKRTKHGAAAHPSDHRIRKWGTRWTFSRGREREQTTVAYAGRDGQQPRWCQEAASPFGRSTV